MVFFFNLWTFCLVLLEHYKIAYSCSVFFVYVEHDLNAHLKNCIVRSQSSWHSWWATRDCRCGSGKLEGPWGSIATRQVWNKYDKVNRYLWNTDWGDYTFSHVMTFFKKICSRCSLCSPVFAVELRTLSRYKSADIILIDFCLAAVSHIFGAIFAFIP